MWSVMPLYLTIVVMCHTLCRDVDDSLVVDVIIGSQTTLASFNATKIKEAVQSTLNKVINDGLIGDLEVDGPESVDIGIPELGTVLESCINCFTLNLSILKF